MDRLQFAAQSLKLSVELRRREATNAFLQRRIPWPNVMMHDHEALGAFLAAEVGGPLL